MCKTKRQVCEFSTNTICSAVNAAVEVLQESACHVNGYGILYDVLATQGALSHARSLIEQAQKALVETSWPTNAEYDKW